LLRKVGFENWALWLLGLAAGLAAGLALPCSSRACAHSSLRSRALSRYAKAALILFYYSVHSLRSLSAHIHCVHICSLCYSLRSYHRYYSVLKHCAHSLRSCLPSSLRSFALCHYVPSLELIVRYAHSLFYCSFANALSAPSALEYRCAQLSLTCSALGRLALVLRTRCCAPLSC
jgi:hypothetical protein